MTTIHLSFWSLLNWNLKGFIFQTFHLKFFQTYQLNQKWIKNLKFLKNLNDSLNLRLDHLPVSKFSFVFVLISIIHLIHSWWCQRNRSRWWFVSFQLTRSFCSDWSLKFRHFVGDAIDFNWHENEITWILKKFECFWISAVSNPF